MQPTCANCQFSVESDRNPADLRAPRGLLCRRAPPLVVVVGIDPSGGVATASLFPTVNPTIWCGEHQPTAAACKVVPS